MTLFDKREHAHENKFAHDAEQLFRATVRRNRLAGAWLAEVLGQGPAAADIAAEQFAALALAGAGDEALFQRIRADCDAAGVVQSDHRIRRELDALMARAAAEVRTAAPGQ